MMIAYILSAPQMINFLDSQILAMKNSGLTPIIFTPRITPQVYNFSEKNSVDVFVVPMERDIALWSDFITFLRLTLIFRKLRPALLVTVGPKASLLGGAAGWITRIPCRIQTKWGIRLETARGLLRMVLKVADKIASACAHLVLCDSQSSKERTIELGLAPRKKVVVIGAGSSRGVDAFLFQKNNSLINQAAALRKEWGVAPDVPLAGFVGRLNLDKGIGELLLSWKITSVKCPKAKLIIIGPDECNSRIELNILKELNQTPGIVILGEKTNLLPYYAALDLLILPTHREGLPNVVLEAAAFEIPTVGFKVTGMVDAVIDGETGALVDFKDIENLAKKIVDYFSNPELRKKHGKNARYRVLNDFNPRNLRKGYFEIFKSTAERQGISTSGLKWVE